MTTFMTRDKRWLAPLRRLVVVLACASWAWAGSGGGSSAQTFAGTDNSGNTAAGGGDETIGTCLLYTSPSPRDLSTSRMPSSA